jgi:crotonobetaine/carnitine-CoA ligase
MSEPDPRDEDLLALIDRQATRYGQKTFITFGDGSSMSYRDLRNRVRRVCSHLAARRITKGAVAIMLRNSLFYPVAWLGVVTAGCTAVPINSRSKVDDAGFIVEHSEAVAAYVDDATRSTMEAVGAGPLRELLAEPIEEHPAPPEPNIRGGSLASIQYTSGTTGFPKGCRLTHRFWQRMGATAVEIMGLTEDDILLTSQPHSYIDPQWNVIATLRAGAHLVLLEGFHPSKFMADVARFGATVFYCVGVMPTLLMKQPPTPADRDHSLTRVFCSAIPVDLHGAIEERWGVPWSEVFGMTETGINTVVAAADHDRCIGSGSIGKVVAHNEAAIVDEGDRELPDGEVGELVIRGLGLMEGYHRDPQATAQFFRNGWAHTGDLGVRDEEGFLYLRGRRKEMIRRGGENISPTQIEFALSDHPDVMECAVAAVPDLDMGEEIKAYVVLRAGSAVDAAELASHLVDRLATFKVPRYWEFRASLPHTPSERVAKHELEEGRPDFRQDSVDLKRRRFV